MKGGGRGLENTYDMRKKRLRPKGTWISPFAHRTACQTNKKNFLNLNQCSNLEKSLYAEKSMSLNSQLKPDKIYEAVKK